MRTKDRTFECLYCNKDIKWKGYSTTHKYCNNTCSSKHKHQLVYEKNKELFSEGELKRRVAIKPILIEMFGNKCSICGQESQHNGKSLTMVLDHIDGNATNNIPNNLRLVCPNCDSQLPTFKAKNRGNGRAKHGLKWYSNQ